MRKFTIDGQEVEAIQQLEDGTWAAKQIWYCDDEFYYDDELTFFERLFDEPPTSVWSEKVQRLMEEVAELEDRRAEVAYELRDAKKARDEQMKQFATVPELKNLEDILAGRITHYAVFDYSPSILSFDSTKVKDKGGYRLLTLFGKPHKSVGWFLNNYEDGSGSNTSVMPCTSLKQAQDAVSAYVSEQHRDGKTFSLQKLEQLAKQGVLIEDFIIDEARSRVKDRLANDVEEAERKLEEARKKLEAIE